MRLRLVCGFDVTIAIFCPTRWVSRVDVPAVILQLAQNKFTLIGAARFVQRGIWVLGTLRHSAKDLGRQMVRLDARLRANNDQALDEVAQLANVSGPRMPQQNLRGGIAELAGSLAVRGAELVQEMLGQDGDILFAVAQRRHEEGNYVQPVEEVLAEGAARDLLFEILVCGGEHANVDA